MLNVLGHWYNSGVITIRAGGFKNTALKSVEIPDTVTKIEEYAFEDCNELTTVVIPESITVMDRDIFRNHNENLTIYGYHDTKAEEYANANNIK